MANRLRLLLEKTPYLKRNASADSLQETIAILRAQQESTLDGILVVGSDGRILSHNSRFREIWGIPADVAAKGRDEDLLEYAFSLVSDRHEFIDQVNYLYNHPRDIRTNDVVTLNDGRVLSRASVPVLSEKGHIYGRAWYFRDITDLEREQRLRGVLFTISEVAHTAPTLDDLFRSVHRLVGELMDATNFYIAIYDETTDQLDYAYFVDQMESKPEPDTARGLTWYVLRTGQPLLATPSRFDEMVNRGEIEPIGAPSLDWLGVPLVAGDHTFGVLGVQSYNEHVRYGDREKDILVFVSQHVARAIEQKRQEQAIRESKEYSESLIKAANAVIAHLDAEGKIQLLNETAERIIGYTLPEVKGKNWLDVLLPPGKPKHLWEEAAFKHGRPLPQNLEFTILTKSGLEREISWRNSEVRDGDRLIGTVCIGFDVTERRHGEEALRESEMRYRQMFENNPAVKLIINPESGEIVDANRAACLFYGYTKDEITNKQVWDLNVMSPEEVRYEMARATSQRRNFFRFQHRTSHGEVRDVEVHSGPVHLHGQTLLYSIITDVTDSKRAEEALRESESKYRSIFDFAKVGIYQADREGRILTANESLARILGYDSVNELLGKNLAEDIYYDRNQRESILAEWDSGESTDFEVIWRRKDDSPIWVQLNAHPVSGRLGGTVYYEGFVHDISARKVAEDVLRTQSAAFKASMDGIAILNEQGEFTYMNEAHSDLYGYDGTAEMIGKPWKMLYEDREFHRFSTEIMPRLWSSGHWRGEATGRRRNGTTFPQEVSLTALEGGGLVCVVRDTTERNVAEEQIRHLAYHDILTSLPNRLLFKDRLTVALSRAQRENSKLALLYLDLDHFKKINDSLGHNVGDHLLQAVASRIKECIRDSDTVARLGGDEFTVLVPVLSNAEDAALIASKIIHAVRNPYVIDGRDLFITTSIGISYFPEDGSDAETILKHADTAMYQAKENGRNTYQLFNARINAHAMERLALENGLRKGIDREEFKVYYQGIFDLKTGRIVGMEGLARWHHPELGVVPPVDFIPLAESLRLMGEIGQQLMRAALQQLRKWRDMGFTDLTLAINLSVSQLQQEDLVEMTSRLIKECGVPCENVELEITESTAMENPEVTTRSLRELKKAGVRVALDDFGTGHSSLSYLKKFPIDTLKIDQSFVRDCTRDSATGAIVTAIIAMAKSLRLKIVAEGVEEEEQRKFLLSRGCPIMQGFLFNRPIPADQFEELLRTNRALKS